MLRSFPSLALLLTPLLWGCHASSPTEAPWAVTFGGDGQIFPFLAVDPSGAVAMAGSFQGDLDLGGGKLEGSPSDNDVFVGMFAADGKPMWSGATGGPGEQAATGVAFDPDGNVIVLGGFDGEVSFGEGKLTALQHDAFMAKLDRAGKATWVKHWSGDDGGPSGNGTISPAGMVATSDGITFGGSFTGSVGFGGPPLDSTSLFEATSFVARVDHDGEHVFSVAFGGDQNQVDTVAVDDGGDVYVSGTNQGHLEIGGATFDAFGQTTKYVARLGSDGTPRWAFQVGIESGAMGGTLYGALTPDSNGDVYFAGDYAGTIKIDRFELSSVGFSAFVLKLSGDGKPLWIHDFPNAGVGRVGIDDEGRVLVSGYYTGPSDFGGGKLPSVDTNAAFITTLEPSKGKHEGTQIFGVLGHPSGIDSLVVTGKDVVVIGDFTDSIELPDKTLTDPHHSGLDLDFLARFHL